jgi:hypothetical protein
VELSDADINSIMRGKTNPLWAKLCSGYAEERLNLNLMQAFCNKYIREKYEPGALTIELLENDTGHCGYCSDNDGTTSTVTSTQYYYLLLPENYTVNNIPALYKSFGVATCYCGGNTLEYKIQRIYVADEKPVVEEPVDVEEEPVAIAKKTRAPRKKTSAVEEPVATAKKTRAPRKTSEPSV